MAMVMVIITTEVIMVVLHDGGDCDVSDGSHGGDGEDDMLMVRVIVGTVMS